MLESVAGWMTGGDSGAAVVPVKPEESLLIKAVRYDDADPVKLGQWVAMGAPGLREEGVKKLTGLKQEARAHWAFQQVKKPALPAVQHTEWCCMDGDRFILARLEAAGLEPSTEARPDALADKRTDLLHIYTDTRVD